MTTVLERAVPFDMQPLYLTEWRAMSELLDGPLRNVGGGLAVSTPAVDLRVEVASGEAAVGGLLVENASVKTLYPAAADPDLGRVDLVVVRIDHVTKMAYLAVVAGTPAASPVAPSPADDPWSLELPLAEVTVAAGDLVLSAADVVDRRLFAVPAHGAGGLIARLSVDADASPNTTAETLLAGWTLAVRLRAGRAYQIRATFTVQNAGNSDVTTRVRDGSLAGTVLMKGVDTAVASPGAYVDLWGLFAAQDVPAAPDLTAGLHTLVVSTECIGSSYDMLGATQAAVANGHARPWFTVLDTGPA